MSKPKIYAQILATFWPSLLCVFLRNKDVDWWVTGEHPCDVMSDVITFHWQNVDSVHSSTAWTQSTHTCQSNCTIVPVNCGPSLSAAQWYFGRR